MQNLGCKRVRVYGGGFENSLSKFAHKAAPYDTTLWYVSATCLIKPVLQLINAIDWQADCQHNACRGTFN